MRSKMLLILGMDRMRRISQKSSGAASAHPKRSGSPSRRFQSQIGPKTSPDGLQDEPRLHVAQLQKLAFRVGGVSKVEVSRLSKDRDGTKSMAEIDS